MNCLKSIELGLQPSLSKLWQKQVILEGIGAHAPQTCGFCVPKMPRIFNDPGMAPDNLRIPSLAYTKDEIMKSYGGNIPLLIEMDTKEKSWLYIYIYWCKQLGSRWTVDQESSRFA